MRGGVDAIEALADVREVFRCDAFAGIGTTARTAGGRFLSRRQGDLFRLAACGGERSIEQIGEEAS